MDANRYFEEMHKAIAAQKTHPQLLLCARYQDLAGNDAYIELRQSHIDHSVRVFYSTMGRKNLSFQLFRQGWQLCHNEAGEMTASFPSNVDSVIPHTEFRAFCRSEALDEAKASRIVRELTLCSGTYIDCHTAHATHGASFITVESFVGAGAHWAWACPGTPNENCLTPAAILYWLADFLAGNERRALQSDSLAANLASKWEMEIEFSNAIPLSRPTFTPGRTRAQAYAARARVPGKNERWQSFLAVMAAV